MGWREREWAKFTDDERRAVFGSGSSTYLPPSMPLTRAEHGNRVRAVVWSAVAVAAAGVGGFGYSQRHPAPAGAPLPAIVYGTAISSTLACDNEVKDAQSQQWQCIDFVPIAGSTEVRTPQPAPSGCVHVIADQARGLWTCTTFAPSY